MSMYELTQILWRRRRMVAVIAALILVAGSTAVLAKSARPTYTARSQVIVDQPALLGSIDGVNVPNKLNALLPTLCTMIEGDTGASDVAREAGESVAAVRSMVRCSPRANTTIADLAVTATTPARARRLVAAGADALVDQIRQHYQDGPVANRIEASVLVAARTPGRDASHVKTQLALVVVAALIGSAALAVAAEPHRNENQSEAHAESAPPIMINANGRASARHTVAN